MERSSPVLGAAPPAVRLCRSCHITLPLRAKHCNDCGRCVRTHDHHCPWIGNCVGERNRAFFFWFVLAQATEAAWLLMQGGQCLRSKHEAPGILVLGLVVVLLFALALGPLVVCHLWLAAANLTTWEYLRWRRIPYLRALPPEGGSPFSASLAQNLVLYCCAGPQVALLRRGSGRWTSCLLHGESGNNELGGGNISMATGEVLWRAGAPHVPYLLRNECYSCYFPPPAHV